jgi:hypothetical protein
MDIIVPSVNYTFVASTKTITLLSPYNSTTIEQIKSIKNITRGLDIYDSANCRYSISVDAGAIIFTYDATMDNSDKFQITIDQVTIAITGIDGGSP